jgi:hypothetical protein
MRPWKALIAALIFCLLGCIKLVFDLVENNKRPKD